MTDAGAVIRVVVVDDHAVVREGIRHMLDGEPDLRVVGEGSNGEQALSLVRSVQPDVLLLDVTMPGESGIAVTTRVRADHPTTRVLILSMHNDREYIAEAVRVGAHGYLLKDAGPAEVREAVRKVFRGQAFFSPAVATQLRTALQQAQNAERQSAIEQLSPREREVLTMVAGGYTSKQIAAELGISPRTVETHRESLMRKLEIRTVAGLTRFALINGLLGP